MAEAPEEQLPTDFGKYRLTRRIATGGMAEIFLAHRRDEPSELLVIKRILPHLARGGGDFLSMFLDEARIAAALRHENIVHIEDVGNVEGAYYIAMEYVHGEDIRRIFNRAYKLQRSLPLSHSIRVIADAALGLGYAHKLTDIAGRPMGVVHRDVSPQNILVTYDGHVKIVDFGIAKAAGKVTQTRAGVLKGKYSYMSPEQAIGDAIDHRTDIFALGIILYETTTGTRLFKRHNELATLQAIIKCDFVPPTKALPGYPERLERVLLKALAKRPADRFANAEDFSSELYAFLRSASLFVERSEIAAFMRELFSERLKEEAGTGQPALPSPDEIREELKETAVANSPSSEASAPRVPSGLADTTPSQRSHPKEAWVASQSVDPSEDVLPRAPTRPIRPAVSSPEATAEDDATGHEERGEPDLLPTEYAHPSFLPGPAANQENDRPAWSRHGDARDPRDASAYEAYDAHAQDDAHVPEDGRDPHDGPDARDGHVAGDRDEGGRAKGAAGTVAEGSLHRRRSGRPGPTSRRRDEVTEHEADAEDAGGRNTSFRLLVLGIAVLVAMLAGVVVARFVRAAREAEGLSTPSALTAKTPSIPDLPERDAMPHDTLPPARLQVMTEPGTEVFVGARRVGVSLADGSLGPIEVPSGVAELRVANLRTGFERRREVRLEPGQNYVFEIPGRVGWLRVAAAPWARVIVDGKDMGLTPLPPLQLFEGVHEIRLENPELGRKKVLPFTIEPGQDHSLRVNLQETGEPM